MKYRMKSTVFLAEKYQPGDQEQMNRLGIFSAESIHRPFPIIQTQRGDLTVFPDDWVITSLNGMDKWLCPDHVFQTLFEPEG